MCSGRQICNCNCTVFYLCLYTVYCISFIKIFRKASCNFYFKSCICSFYISCCCSCSGNYRYIGIFNIKIDNTFICIVGYTGNRFSHHGFVMCRAYRASMNGCGKACTPCKMTASPDIFQMAKRIGGSVCSIDNSTVNIVF